MTENTPLRCDNNGKILIVDDEEIVRYSLVKILNHLQYPAHGVGSGAEALAYVVGNESAIGAILCDLRLDDMDGVELLKRVRQFANEEIPFALMSGQFTAEVHEEYQNLGVSALISKPMTIEELSIKIPQLLSAQRRSKSSEIYQYHL